MSLLAEEIVEEWLNRKGYFTIRGIKIGVDEMDILAIKPSPVGEIECRHIEVQSSMRPVSYISKLPKDVQKSTGRSAHTVKRSDKELVAGVNEYVNKKFLSKKKLQFLESLHRAGWTKELVVNVVKSKEEVDLIRKQGVRIHQLREIVVELKNSEDLVQRAHGSDLVDLIHLAES